MASLDVWKVPSLLFSSWFYCLISEAANVFFFFLMLIQHLMFEKPIFSEMQLLKNTRFSWGTQCLVLRYELNVYVNKITWVPYPCCGFTNLSSKSLVSFTFHTQLTLWHLEVVCYLAIHLWEKEHWVNLDGLGLVVPEITVHVCLALFLWAHDKTGYHIAGTTWQSNATHLMMTKKQGKTRTGSKSGSSSLTHCQLPSFLPVGATF